MAKMGWMGPMLNFVWQGNQNQGSSLQQKWWVMSRRAHGQQRLPSGRLSRFCILQCSLFYWTHVWSLLCLLYSLFYSRLQERDLCSSFSEVSASLASDRMRGSLSLPTEAWASHFSMRKKKNILSWQILRNHNLFQLMLNRVAKLDSKGSLCRYCWWSWNYWRIPC